MATPGMAQPSVKKRSFLLRDLFKLCRSISRVLPRDKPNHHKAKHERKLHTNESKRKDEEPKPKPNPNRNPNRNPNPNPNPNLNPNPNAFNFKETNKVEGVSLIKVRSYRFDNTNTNSVGNKKPFSLSRSCSLHKAPSTTATIPTKTSPTLRSLSFIGRSKSSCNRSDPGLTPSLIRSTTTVPRSFANPILYSSSSANVAKPSPTEKKLRCTLEELCNGCTKKINIKRDVITSSGQMSEEEETVEIKVKPGWKGGTRVTFEGKGNEAMGSVPADLTFVIVEKEHEVFKREGDDLEMSVEVSLLEALTGCEISVALLNGDNMSLKVEEVIHPGYVRIIQGKGMPNLKENGKMRGDLRIRFRTKFPQQLTDEQRAEFQNILQDSSS